MLRKADRVDARETSSMITGLHIHTAFLSPTIKQIQQNTTFKNTLLTVTCISRQETIALSKPWLRAIYPKIPH